jgi:hypothetical protein
LPHALLIIGLDLFLPLWIFFVHANLILSWFCVFKFCEWVFNCSEFSSSFHIYKFPREFIIVYYVTERIAYIWLVKFGFCSEIWTQFSVGSKFHTLLVLEFVFNFAYSQIPMVWSEKFDVFRAGPSVGLWPAVYGHLGDLENIKLIINIWCVNLS